MIDRSVYAFNFSQFLSIQTHVKDLSFYLPSIDVSITSGGIAACNSGGIWEKKYYPPK
ncbi:MAG: hypothetical protein M3530_02310 [Thermoproteota archaeon]|nr:hypothetical protein [Thermoproteota archaeon]